MAKFMLLLHHAPDRYEGLSQDEFMEIIKDYVAWVQAQTEAGVYLGGEKLDGDPGYTLRRSGQGIEVHESPSAELHEVLGGYMVIEAPDYDAAVEIARSHPHLVHNRAIQLRRIHEVG